MATIRQFVVISPLFYMIMATGIASIPWRKALVVTCGLLVAADLILLHSYYMNDPDFGLRAGAEYIARHSQPGDIIIHLQPNSLGPFRYYITGSIEYELGKPGYLEGVDQGFYYGRQSLWIETVIEQRVWIVAYHLTTLKTRVMDAFSDVKGKETNCGEDLDSLWLSSWLKDEGFRKTDEQRYLGANPVCVRLFQRVR
jgi:hypothetical protein